MRLRATRPQRRTKVRILAAALAAATLPLPAAFAAGDTTDSGPRSSDAGLFEVFAPDGTISMVQGGPDGPKPRTAAAGAAAHTVFENNGPSTNRLDFIFLGDGYTAQEMGKFAEATQHSWDALMAKEPLKTYRKYINGHRVDVASPVSGISNDPGKNNPKTTPLGMRFWCHDIDRLLCVDNSKAREYAKVVPIVNEIITIANTSTYGGAGGSVTTVAGGNRDSAQVLQHEMGHTLGKLGDEYDVPYASGGGTEPKYPNLTAYPSAQMKQHNIKWAPWLGTNSPDGAVVSTVEGGNHYKKGFYRPTPDSLMRTLGKEFNSPSVEAMLKGIYNVVDPIDTSLNAPKGLRKRDTAWITVPQLVGNRQLDVVWTVDGKQVASGPTQLALSGVPTTKGKWNLLTVTAKDNTPWMKDEAFRKAEMTASKSWWLWGE